jgi:CHAT domain-containing protein/Tfp pilus assembly protein PilF
LLQYSISDRIKKKYQVILKPCTCLIILIFIELIFFQGSGIISIKKVSRQNFALAESKYAEAYKLFDKGNNTEAVVLFEEASILYFKSENWSSYLISLINAGKCYRNIENYDTAEAIFARVEKIGLEKLDSNDLIFSTLYSAQAYLSCAIADYEKSINLAEKSILIREQKNGMNDSLFMYPYYVLGKDYYYLGNYDQAEKNYRIALVYSMLCKDNASIDVANNWTGLGQVLWTKGDYDKSLSCFNKAQSIYNGFIKKNYDVPEYANNNISISTFYSQLGYYKKSLEILYITENYLKNKFPSLHSLIGIVHTYKALNYLKAYDYVRTITECDVSLSIFKKDSITNNVYAAYDYYYLGLAYSGINKIDKAITCFSKYIEYKEKNNQSQDPYSFFLLARSYEKIKQIPKADSIYRIIITKLKKINENPPILATILQNYGAFCLNNSEQDIALECYSEALRICKSRYGYNNVNTATNYNLMAKLWTKQGKYDDAVHYYQLALASQLNNIDSSDIYINPPAKKITADIELLITLKGKGNTFFKKYISDSSKMEYLRASLQSYELAIIAIDKLKISYSNSESASTLLENENETFDEAVEVASQLYIHTDSDKYFDIAFSLAEKSKSSSLLAAIRNNEALIAGKVPVAFQNFEKTIQQQIEQYNQLLYEENKSEKANSKKITYWNSKLADLNTTNDNLVQYIEKAYPEYYNLKYNTAVISADSIAKKLSDDEAFIEYTVTDEKLVSFIITGETKKINVHPIDSSFTSSVEKYALCINNPDATESQSCNQFVSSSTALYKVLLKPFETLLFEKKLIIVPDEILYNTPFESLLYTDVKSDADGFSKLPYLIKHTAISYAASGTLLFEKNETATKTNSKLLAFAPTYENISDSNSTESSITRDYLKSIKPLPGAAEEVNNISTIIDGDVYKGNNATLANFKKHTSDYGILHLAMHTMIDDENPMYSKLAFEQGKDDNGLLNTYELYNMQINSQLSVLSACKTGSGKIVKGEGMLCLARGFMYAGCPSLVMTLWEIDDKSGAELMKSFYGYLSDGKAKDEALRLAKLDYINSSDKLKTNPYYWAGYINFGNNQPLQLKHNDNTNLFATIFIFAGGLVFLLVSFLYKRYLRKSPGFQSE